jgi:3-hydroxyisobutyrate dehydrogenase-like beta-hydroxyacid dehydrogenase
MTTIGVVSPGAMGAALGRAWAAGGARVVATVAGRSPRTRSLARGIELLPGLEDVVAVSDLVVSICPPGVSREVADAVCRVTEKAVHAGRRPVYADLNAVAPITVEAVAARVAAAGLPFVDGAVSGGPPQPGGDTMLFLSGARATWLAGLPADGLRRRVVGDRPGTASAAKMCTASIYKGTTALWAQALQTAQHHGVLDVVLDDLGEEFPDAVSGAGRRIATSASKAARFVGEMEEIALTQGAAGASPELFEAMAAVYARLAGTPLAALTPEEAQTAGNLEDVLSRLARDA